MPRGIYDRTPKNAKSKKRHKPSYGTSDYEYAHADNGSNINVSVIVRRDDLDVLRDIMAMLESLTEDAKYRVMQYLIHKYKTYGPVQEFIQ